MSVFDIALILVVLVAIGAIIYIYINKKKNAVVEEIKKKLINREKQLLKIKKGQGKSADKKSFG